MSLLFFGLAAIYALATLVPTVACAVRGLHDIGKSGWWIALGLIPVADIALIALLLFTGDHNDNQHGPNPRLSPPTTGYRNC